MQLRNLAIGYGHPLCSPVKALLEAGDFVCLVGRNGSGKSTLLRTLAGLIAPLGGEVIVGDKTIGEMSPRGISRTLAIVLTRLPELRHTTARQIAASGRLPYTGLVGHLRAADYGAADQALSDIGILHLRDRLFHTLSDGEKQKTMLARALAQGTEYLLLDEPSAFLDWPSRRELFSLLRSLAHTRRKAVLLSTHDLELAVASADRLWVLRDGKFSVEDPNTFDLSGF